MTVPKKLRDLVWERDDASCTRCGVNVTFRPHSVHHRRLKGMGGSKTAEAAANLIVLCGSGSTGCHGAVHGSPTASYRDGFLVPNGEDFNTWPVYRLEQWLQPTADGWVPSEPHQRQIDLGGAA